MVCHAENEDGKGTRTEQRRRPHVARRTDAMIQSWRSTCLTPQLHLSYFEALGDMFHQEAS